MKKIILSIILCICFVFFGAVGCTSNTVDDAQNTNEITQDCDNYEQDLYEQASGTYYFSSVLDSDGNFCTAEDFELYGIAADDILNAYYELDGNQLTYSYNGCTETFEIYFDDYDEETEDYTIKPDVEGFIMSVDINNGYIYLYDIEQELMICYEK